MYFPSAYFRAKARGALKGNWQTALLIALIVNLPTLLVQGIATFTGNDPVTRLQSIIITASRDGILNNAQIAEQIRVFLRSQPFWITMGSYALSWLVTPFLSLGMNSWLINRLRGQAPEPVTKVFCRAPQFFKAIWLQIMIIFKVFLWMLPGIGVMVLAMLPVYNAENNTAALASAMNLSQGLMLPDMVVMAIPGVMAALRYAMAEYILADEPDETARKCLRRSITQMRDNKKMLFLLMVSFLLWYLAQMMVASLLMSLGSGVLAQLFQMLTGLALNLYFSGSVASFYLETAMGRIPKHGPAGERQPAEAEEEKNEEET